MQQPHTARPSLRFSIYLRLLHAQGLRPGHPLAFESSSQYVLLGSAPIPESQKSFVLSLYSLCTLD